MAHMRRARFPIGEKDIDDLVVREGERLLRWEELFSSPAPVEIEIGSGKGGFLLTEAARRPERNFLGIERRVSHLRVCAERAVRRGLRNLRLLRANAVEILWARIPPASVAAFHVYYPDPWWKARHKKRRIFTPDFIADLARALVPGGELRMATDVEEYFEQIVRLAAESGLFDAAQPTAEEFGTPDEPLTSYQAKYLRLGRPIHAALFRSNGTPAPPTPAPRERMRLLKERRRAERGAMAEG